jgi:hypothetical protein
MKEHGKDAADADCIYFNSLHNKTKALIGVQGECTKSRRKEKGSQ